MNDIWIIALAVAISVLIGIALVFLFRKKIINLDMLDQAGDLLESIDITGSGFVATLAEYARIAVRTVEQLAKNGVIDGNNVKKKAAAMEYLQQFAKIDEVSLSPADLDTADALIEAAVNELPHGKPPDAAE